MVKNHRITLSLAHLSIFFTGTDNSELTVARYHRMISAQFPLGKKETTKRETWIQKKYLLMQFMLTVQKVDYKVGCTCDHYYDSI